MAALATKELITDQVAIAAASLVLAAEQSSLQWSEVSCMERAEKTVTTAMRCIRLD